MKVFIQWTTNPVQDWIQIDSSEWSRLPKRPEPVGDEIIDDQPGWIYALNIQGVHLSGDHYAMWDMPDESLAVAALVDNIEDRPTEDFYGVVGYFVPPAFDRDPRVRRINTRQQFHIFAAPRIKALMEQSQASNRVIKPFSEFPIIPDKLIRHGINLSEELNAKHNADRILIGWREWIEK